MQMILQRTFPGEEEVVDIVGCLLDFVDELLVWHLLTRGDGELQVVWQIISTGGQ